MEKENSLINMPGRLFKYYKYDSDLNIKRLRGEVYLSSPLDFNDPCDCRILPDNNVKSLNKKDPWWLLNKMRELGFDKGKSAMLARSLRAGDDDLQEVHQRQLEKMGILCLTSSYDDTQMWGYYADNDGICIEYDTSKLVERLVHGFVNSLDFGTTQLLFDQKKYSMSFDERRAFYTKLDKDATIGGSVDNEKEAYAQKIFAATHLKKKDIKNDFLLSKYAKSLKHVAHFMQHVFVKRFAGQPISYEDGELIKPTLFFESVKKESKNKYFQKTAVWQHEKEFRIVVSLGGRKVIDLGKDIIKSVYFGCDVPVEKAVELACILFVNQPKCKLFQMKRLDAGGLAAHEINRSALKNPFKTIMRQLEAKRVK